MKRQETSEGRRGVAWVQYYLMCCVGRASKRREINTVEMLANSPSRCVDRERGVQALCVSAGD